MDKMPEDQKVMNNSDEQRKNQSSPNREQPIPHLLSKLPSDGSGRVLRFKSGTSSKLQPIKRTETPSPSDESEAVLSNNGSRREEFMPVNERSISTSFQREDTAAVIESEDQEQPSSEDTLMGHLTVDNQLTVGPGTHHYAVFVVGDSSDDSASASNRSSDYSDSRATNSAANIPPPPSYDSACRKMTTHLERNPSSLSVVSIQPPSYRDAVGARRFLEDAPPTYHALFSNSVFRMIDLNGDHNGIGDDLPMSFTACIITYCIISAVIIFGACMALFLPLAMIIIGVAHLHSCPAQPRIPVFLTSMGVFQLLECCGRCSMYIYTKLKTQNQREEVRYKSKDPFVYFIVVWFVVGSMWVYQNYPTCHDFIQNPSLQRDIIKDPKFAKPSRNLTISNTRDTLGKYPHIFNTKPPSTKDSSKSINSDSSAGDGTLATNRQTTEGTTLSFSKMLPTRQSASTLMKPKSKPKAACCGKVVYFFTFGVVTLYYSMIGLWFMLNLCCTFFKMFHRCRDDQHCQ
ncbi:uncharacterized protein LOC135696658 isoform X1 [Rhopilema esculentum]|uniref:uncharacterized protein LOC135696658 isoform X1 n=1 Tax=Rhopilema esculentum TaxID=499914 RepID=UPI0031DC9E1A